MIWQLVRVDPAWRVALWLTPFGVIGGLFLSADLGFLCMPFFCATVLIVRSSERATLFTAALPVSARQLLLARICATFATWWLPAIAAIVTSIVAGRRPEALAGNVAAIALAITAWAFFPLSIRPREFSAPVWPVLTCVAIAWVGAIALSQQRPEVMAAVSTLIAGFLFWRTWRATPASFQTAPMELSKPAASAEQGIGLSIAWWPVARTVLLPMLLFWPVALLGVQASDQWLYVTLFACVPVGTALMRSHWALTLPIHRGRFLAAIFACGALPLVAGYYGRLLNGAAVLATFLLLSNGILIGMHHRFRRLPKSVRVLGYVAAAVAIRFAAISVEPAWERLAPATLAASVLLFWTATRLFRGIEILNPRYVSMWDSMSQK
jgi:hypothetical protein